MRLRAAHLFPLVLLAACREQDPTEIVLELRTDIPVPSEMNRLRLRLSSANHPDFFDQHFQLGGDAPDIQLPGRVTLVPQADVGTVEIQVDGLLDETRIVSRRAIAPFVKNQALLLQIELSQVCVASRFRGCDIGSTCIGGSCAPERVDPARLPRVSPGEPIAPSSDAAVLPDAAPAPDATTDRVPIDTPTDTGPLQDGPAGSMDGPSDAPLSPPDAPADLAVPDAAPDLSADAPPPPPDGAPKKANGDPCGSGPECVSTFCVDGVCCGVSCQGLCRSCNQQGRAGSCVMIGSGEDPANECGDDGLVNCKRDGFCDGMGACRLHAAGTECLAPGCAGATHMLGSTCDGVGNCRSSGSESCSPYVCGVNGACKTSCSGLIDCLTPYACLAGSCVSPTENCGNGVDDDNDGFTDCADSDCTAGYQCAPLPPAGWIGPVAFVTGQQNAMLSCAAPFPVTSYTGQTDLTCTAASCSACACGSPAQVSCQPPPLIWYGGGPCFGIGTPGSTGYACSLSGLLFDASQVDVGPSLASGGRCPAQGGIPSVTEPMWRQNALACQPPSLRQGGCGGAEACAPKAPPGFESKLCVYSPGDQSCPGGYTGSRRLYYKAFTDGRDCTRCSCEDPKQVVCGGQVEFHADKDCGQLIRSVSVPSPSCAAVDKGNVATRYLPSFSGGSCQPNGGAPTGGCQPQTPTTVCCQ